MNKPLLKFSLVCVTGAVFLAANPKQALAYEEPVAGFTYDKSNSQNDEDDTILILSMNDIPIPGFKNTGIANVDTNLLIRQGPGEDKKILGKLPKDGGCEILEKDKNGWTKVKSGKITGFVKSSYLITGTEASKIALKVGNLVAKVNKASDVVNIRKEPTVNSPVIDKIADGEELLVLEGLVVSYGEEYNKWVKVSLDSDNSAEGSVGYISKEFVNLSYELKKAFSVEEAAYGTGVSSTRVNLINSARKYLGYRYVWGGTNLNTGVDCSGYTKELYRLYGITLPRTSRQQAVGGTTVTYANLKPGDLVFYGSSGYINHVAIFIGNGQIIHASNKRDGIKISNMFYRQPVKYVRYINN